MKNMSLRKIIVLGVFIGFAVFLGYRGYKLSQGGTFTTDGTGLGSHQNEILHLEINGVIMNGKKFLERLKKYAEEKSIKAIVIEINSPGGAVGPSQELYSEIKRTKEEVNKPIICVSTGLIASGGYYASLACDHLVVSPGTMIGSIGVIMEFANLEDLYSWAKIKRYTITSGKYKDSGAEYRAMRDDERELFQEMIDEVYNQFRTAVAESRELPMSVVDQYADGRVMTGAKAVKLKFADSEGTFEDAVRIAAAEAQLGDDYSLFKPRKEKASFFDVLMSDEEDDDLNSFEGLKDTVADVKSQMQGQSLDAVLKTVFKMKSLNQPMMIMPGYWD